jgi:hypothetical protein
VGLTDVEVTGRVPKSIFSPRASGTNDKAGSSDPLRRFVSPRLIKEEFFGQEVVLQSVKGERLDIAIIYVGTVGLTDVEVTGRVPKSISASSLSVVRVLAEPTTRLVALILFVVLLARG